MSNATISEIYENARQRIVNSALGQALGMTSNTEILDAAIDVEGVEVCSDAQATTYNLDTTNSRVRFYLPKTGFWKNTNHIWQSYANLASLIGLSSDKLISDVTILGVAGNQYAVKVATGLACKQSTKTVNVSSILSDYQNLTVKNFVVELTKTVYKCTDYKDRNSTVSVSKSYDPTTGIFSVHAGCAPGGSEWCEEYLDVWVIKNIT